MEKILCQVGFRMHFHIVDSSGDIEGGLFRRSLQSFTTGTEFDVGIERACPPFYYKTIVPSSVPSDIGTEHLDCLVQNLREQMEVAISRGEILSPRESPSDEISFHHILIERVRHTYITN